MIDQATGAGVVEQVDEFLIDVAVVHVERHDPGLVGTEHGFQVLIAVVEVETDVVLAALPILKVLAFTMAAQASTNQSVGESARALGEFPVGEPSAPENDGLTLWHGRRDRFTNRGQVEVHSLSYRELSQGEERHSTTLAYLGRWP